MSHIEGITTIEDCKLLAATLRSELRLSSRGTDRRAPVIERMRVAKEIPLSSPQPQVALGAVADAYRGFVKLRSMRDRIFLGLPRAKESADMALPARVSRHPTVVYFHLARTGAALLLRMASFEIDRLVRGPEPLQQIEEALRVSLALDDETPRSSQPRGQQPVEPRHGVANRSQPPGQRFVAGGYARLEGMRVTIVEIRGDRAIVRLPGSNEPEEVDLDELDPYYPG